MWDAYEMNFRTFLFIFFTLIASICYLAGTYAIDGYIRSNNCSNQTIKSCNVVMQTSSWIMLLLSCILASLSNCGYYDYLDKMYAVLMFVFFMIIEVCSGMIRTQISNDNCFGGDTENVNKVAYNMFAYSWIYFFIILLFSLLVFNSPYTPAGKLIDVINGISYYKLSNGQVYAGGSRNKTITFEQFSEFALKAGEAGNKYAGGDDKSLSSILNSGSRGSRTGGSDGSGKVININL